MRTYGAFTKAEVDMIVSSLLFPAFCFQMDVKMQQAADAMQQTLDAAIKADIEAMIERRGRHARRVRG